MISDLLAARRALRYGVGMTTQRNRVLPAIPTDGPIPDRVGLGKPKHDKPGEETLEDRTFVFSVFNGVVAVIANRIAGSTALRVVRTNMAVAAATYCIAAINTLVSKWLDCWRIDGNTFGIGGHVPPVTVGVGVVPTHERSSLPFIAHDSGYYATCIGDATRSTLFIAKAQDGLTPRVLSIATDGTQKSSVTATNCASTANSGAGARIAADKSIRFYAANVSQAANAVFVVYPGWSVFHATRTTPYIQQMAYGASIPIACRGKPYLPAYNGINFSGTNAHTTAGHSITPTLCPFYLGASVTDRRFPTPNPTFTMEWDEIKDDLYYLTAGDYVDGGLGTHTSTAVNSTIDASIAAYAYVGADLQLSLTARLETDYASDRRFAIRYYPYVSGGSNVQFSGGSEHIVSAVSSIKTTLAVTSQLAALGDLSRVVCTLTGNYSYTDVYTPSVVSIPNYLTTATYSQAFGDAAGLAAAIDGQNAAEYGKVRNPANLSAHNVVRTDTRGAVLTATTRDYLIADIDEEIFLSLDAALALNRSESYDFATLTWTATDTYSLALKYVLRIRGQVTEFPVYSGSGFAAPVIDTDSIFAADANYKTAENYHGTYHPGYKPIPVFAPPFMAQGNCPYIAYTTKAEEAAGATPEFYLDIAIKILQFTTFTGSRYDGIVPVVPHQFLAMFRRYIGGEEKASHPTYPLTQNTTFWATLFPTATPFRIQFANGVAGAWNTSLDPIFAANPATEITRI